MLYPMKAFITGFSVASLMWVGLLYLQLSGSVDLGSATGITPAQADLEVVADAPTEGDLDAKAKKPKRRKKRRGRRHKVRTLGQASYTQAADYDYNEAQVGDDLTRSNNVADAHEVGFGTPGREEQLPHREIDRGIDSVFNGITRCLVLVPAGASTKGKIVVGMNIASSGKVTKVNLKGPNVMVKGESGACLRRTIKSIRYPGFNGPDMVVHYPITFD